MGDRFQPMSTEEINCLIAVSKREKATTVWVKDGQLANLLTGEIEPVQIAIEGKRIAYVGQKEPKTDDNTIIIDASQYTLVPGYIEPHAHPFQMYNPITLSNYVLARGTTTMIADNMAFYNRLGLEQWIDMMEQLSDHPVKLLWWTRLESQSSGEAMQHHYAFENIEKLLNHPHVIQGGELSNWLHLLAGDEDIVSKIVAVKQAGKRMEGHSPGASAETLNALVAAGVTSDHEAITGEEVLRRLRLGLYAPLRHSSIRPDLPVLLEGIKGLKLGWERLMLTTDGSTPPFLKEGFTDSLLSIAIEHGIDPMIVYRMATLNVATYYGLDEHIGLIAPGRYADILFLQSLEQPHPVQVMAEGKIVKSHKEDVEPCSMKQLDWNEYGLGYQKPSHQREITTTDFHIPWEEGKPFPVMHLINDVITVESSQTFPLNVEGKLQVEQEGLLYVALIHREGSWITRGVLGGFATSLSGLATTYTLSMDYLVIGKDFDSMLQAYHHVREHGGIAIVEDQQVSAHLQLPIGGGMSDLPMQELIATSTEFRQMLQDRGFAHGDPYYCLLFLTSTHLPKLRLTEDGIVSIKDQKVVVPSQSLKTDQQS